MSGEQRRPCRRYTTATKEPDAMDGRYDGIPDETASGDWSETLERDTDHKHGARPHDTERRRARHPESERRHAPRHPDGDRQHTPRRSASDLPHTMGRVSLEDILARNPKADRRRAQRSPKAHLFVTICHWSMTVLLALNLLSGMRIGWGYEESQLGGMKGAWASLLNRISPASTMFGVNLINLHVWSSFVLLLVAGVYVGYLLWSGTRRKLSVTRADLRKFVAGLRSGHFWRHKPGLWSANVLVYWTSFIFIGILTVTGFALYRLDLGLYPMLGGYDVVRLVHAVVGYLLIPYTILHATLQWCFGRFWPIFKVQILRRHVLAGLIGLAIAAPLAAGAYLADGVSETLRVPRIGSAQAPVLDGDPNDPIWTLANPVTIHTAKATNAPGHVSDITIRAVHDGTNVYFQFQWADPAVSAKRYPLIKTAGGWKVLQTQYAQFDENVYYEDKLSMYITDVKDGSCATSCHLGASPKSATGEKHGLHYTEGGETADIWHWKWVRTNHMGDLTGEPGWADDMYFGPRKIVKPGERDSGGYFNDPDNGGGYNYNFVKVDPKKSLFDTYVIPKFLPLGTDAVHTNPAPDTNEVGKTWWILKARSVPYTKEADTYPVGTMIPNMVVEQFTGDRADVRAKGEWKDGRWTLETRRVLDTGSKYDVPFVPGQPIYITVATYNRVQTRHSEHIKPVRVVLDK
jgi:thiosulfate reductase cytochrome b subunit